MIPEALKLENQLCFPLYACAREVVRQYKPYLDTIGLTYTQYITMMVLWEHQSLNVKAIGDRLRLDSGTLTPVLKKLESQGYIKRSRNPEDERNLIVELTEGGLALQDRAKSVPEQVGKCIKLDPEDAVTLYRLLYRMLEGMES